MSRVYVVALNERDREVAFLARDHGEVLGGRIQLKDPEVFAKFRLGLDFYLEAAVNTEAAGA